MAQRLTSMLPSDYVETRLDAESRNVLDDLMPSSVSEDEPSSSDADRSTYDDTPPGNSIPRIEWENVATTSSAVNRGDDSFKVDYLLRSWSLHLQSFMPSFTHLCLSCDESCLFVRASFTPFSEKIIAPSITSYFPFSQSQTRVDHSCPEVS